VPGMGERGGMMLDILLMSAAMVLMTALTVTLMLKAASHAGHAATTMAGSAASIASERAVGMWESLAQEFPPGPGQ